VLMLLCTCPCLLVLLYPTHPSHRSSNARHLSVPTTGVSTPPRTVHTCSLHSAPAVLSSSGAAPLVLSGLGLDDPRPSTQAPQPYSSLLGLEHGGDCIGPDSLKSYSTVVSAATIDPGVRYPTSVHRDSSTTILDYRPGRCHLTGLRRKFTLHFRSSLQFPK
jgi:hypothetical protein